MRKNSHLFVIALILTTMFAMPPIAEARTGDASSRSSKSLSSSQASRSKSLSKSSKTDFSFMNAAKTKQAKEGWKSYLKKREQPVQQPDFATQSPVSPQYNATKTQSLENQLADLQSQFKTEKKRKKADKLAKQLAAIEKQIADSRRQQQILAIGQTVINAATQAALKHRPTTSNSSVSPQNTPLNSLASSTASATSVKSSSGKKTSWLAIFLIIAGIVVVIFWLKTKSNSPTTIYRL